jgi:hypothetical protein
MKFVSFNESHPIELIRTEALDWKKSSILYLLDIAAIVRYEIENLLLATFDLE